MSGPQFYHGFSVKKESGNVPLSLINFGPIIQWESLELLGHFLCSLLAGIKGSRNKIIQVSVVEYL